MRHHEDAVDRQRRDTERFVGIDHHQHGLNTARRMGQDAAAADDQVQFQQIDQGLAGSPLLEHIGNGALLLDAFESRRKRFVVDQRQPQGLARDGMFDLQFVERLRNRRGPHHLVLDAVAQGLFVDGKRHPAHDVVEPRLRQHIRNAVGHAEVGADRAVEESVEHREDVGGGAADIDADQVDAFAFGDGLHDDADRRRGRHDGRARHLDEFLVAGSLLHDMFEKQVVDFVAGRRKVFALKDRTDIVGKIQGGLFA